MKFYLKENFHLFLANGKIYEEDGDIAYEYENTQYFFPSIDLYKYGDHIGRIEKRFSWFLNKYDIYHNDVYIDSVDQQFRFIKSELYLNGLGWTIKGDFLSLNYEIYNEDNELIARADQELFRLTQRFYFEIFDEENQDLLILLMLVINQFDKDRKGAAASSASRGG